MTDNIIEIVEQRDLVIVEPDGELTILEAGEQGPEGVVGPPGPQGEPGVPGGAGLDLTYVHDQLISTNIWTITHNLGKIPSVAVLDSAGSVVEGDVTHLSQNELTITFSSAFGGKAILN